MADKVLRRVAGLDPRTRFLVVAGAGAAAGLGQAPVSLPWITLIALWFVFCAFGASANTRKAAWTGLAAGTGYFALTLSWIVEPFLVDIARHGWMAPFALVFSAVGFGLFWALAFGLAFKIARPGWPRALAWAVLLGGAEMLRGYLLTGFPWALIGHVWVGWAPMHLAADVGSYGLTLLTLLLVAGVGVAGSWTKRGLLLVLFGLLYLWSDLSRQVGLTQTAGTPVVVRLIQPNVPQHLKWDPVMAPQFFARALGLTAAPAERPPDLVIWPETAVPYLLRDAGPVLERIAGEAGVPVVLGIQRLDGARAFNSLIALDRAGQVTELYDKHHLVPFGEYIPAGWLLRPLGFSAFTAGEGFGFSAGPGARVLDLGALGKALPLICYEAIFPQDVRAAPERPDWLLQITNDAWFGTISGPYQHLAQARLRAVESGLPLLRAANTGVSAVIDAHGQVTASLALGEAGFLDAVLPPPLPPPLYARTGDLPLALLLALAVLGLSWHGRRKSD